VPVFASAAMVSTPTTSRSHPVTSRTQRLHCIEPTESLTSGIALTFVQRAFL
jgi:hypothetical protein